MLTVMFHIHPSSASRISDRKAIIIHDTEYHIEFCAIFYSPPYFFIMALRA